MKKRGIKLNELLIMLAVGGVLVSALVYFFIIKIVLGALAV